MSSQATIWGIDRRFVVGALIIVFLVAPVFPREKTVQVTDTVQTTITNTSYQYQTLTQASQQQVTVVVGNMVQLPQGGNNNCYWDPYYGWICPGYGANISGQSACGYGYGTTTITVDISDKIIRYDQVNEQGGTWTITLTSINGQTTVYRGVCSFDLTYTGQATVTTSQVVVNTQAIPNTQVVTQPVTHTEVITEHVSILQMLLGY